MDFWKQVKETAFGVLKLRPTEMWGLTLMELIEMAEARNKETVTHYELSYRRTAWLAANLMNAAGTLKQPVTVDLLLGIDSTEDARPINEEDRTKAFRDLVEKFNQ
ncbi:phage tail assembly chaperone [Heliobacillus mobilis]|uniref:Phage tail assembly chaperone n=1 Tax=Heliobacterium mobile TaxID=28064 RepID=A0A6I3SSV9_HELMO|nr:phage tail assembly chaperone [Heliobacterium mobile]MTV51037.1 phage tail assembly chaperone [Heliobacterium mobile]